jgi:hypothetical protein
MLGILPESAKLLAVTIGGVYYFTYTIGLVMCGKPPHGVSDVQLTIVFAAIRRFAVAQIATTHKMANYQTFHVVISFYWRV